MNSHLLKLLHLSDPALPIGGFSHSWGLETYVQRGIVQDEATAKEYVKEMLSQNLHFTDGSLLSLTYDAVLKGKLSDILELDHECSALKTPREIRTGSQRLGWRLIKIFRSSLSDSLFEKFAASVDAKKTPGHYCITFGFLAAIQGISKKDTLSGFYYNAAAGMVTACVKLIPLSQQQGQQMLMSAHGLIEDLAESSLYPDRNKTGWCCPGFDLRSMQHEQLYSRLYMS